MTALDWPLVLTGYWHGEQYPATDVLTAISRALGPWEDLLRGDGHDQAAGHVRLAASHLLAAALELPEPDDTEGLF